eukprot:4000453-Alexandrium_andersonii.AAC.1
MSKSEFTWRMPEPDSELLATARRLGVSPPETVVECSAPFPPAVRKLHESLQRQRRKRPRLGLKLESKLLSLIHI